MISSLLMIISNQFLFLDFSYLKLSRDYRHVIYVTITNLEISIISSISKGFKISAPLPKHSNSFHRVHVHYPLQIWWLPPYCAAAPLPVACTWFTAAVPVSEAVDVCWCSGLKNFWTKGESPRTTPGPLPGCIQIKSSRLCVLAGREREQMIDNFPRQL